MANESGVYDDLIVRARAIEVRLDAFEALMKERDLRYRERSEAQEKAVMTALITAKEAVAKAELATERRLEGLNELREMAADQAETFAHEDKVALRFDAAENQQRTTNISVDARLVLLERNMSSQVGRGSGMNAVSGFMVTGITCVLGIATLIVAIIAVVRIH